MRAPPLHRFLFAASSLALTSLTTTDVRADGPEGIDLNALSAPIQDSSFSAIRGTTREPVTTLRSSFRTTYLALPLSFRIADSSPTGQQSGAVDGAVLTELQMAIATPQGWDFGLSIGAHVFQWGSGSSAITGSDSELASFAPRDPRLEVGFTSEQSTFQYRPFVSIFIPLGNPQAFSGEQHSRLETGISFGTKSPWIEYGGEVSFLYRVPVQISATSWNSQLRLSLGTMFHLTKTLLLGPELHILPVLGSQIQEGSTFGGRMLPAEVLGTFRYRSNSWGMAISGGTGLPLSQSSGINARTTTVRGPTSPLVRTMLEVSIRH